MRFMKEAIAISALLAVLILAISHQQKRLEIDKLKEQLKACECIDEIICTYSVKHRNRKEVNLSSK